jgi:hypothetical protein
MYIRRLTDEYTVLRSSVTGTFLGFGTKKYISVIFLGIEKYKKNEEDTPVVKDRFARTDRPPS